MSSIYYVSVIENSVHFKCNKTASFVAIVTPVCKDVQEIPNSVTAAASLVLGDNVFVKAGLLKFRLIVRE